MDWMFPKTMKSRSNTSNADSFIMVNEEQRILEPQLVGLKIGNQSIELEERLIQVTFYHNSVEVSYFFFFCAIFIFLNLCELIYSQFENCTLFTLTAGVPSETLRLVV